MPERAKTISSVKCERCGTSKADFEKKGLLGCGMCYETFQDDMKFILRRIHGSNKHIGYRPTSKRQLTSAPDVKALQRKLETAIEKEDFEEAAKLRDLIRDAEAQHRRKMKPLNNAKQKNK